jgi:hypothetical protein
VPGGTGQRAPQWGARRRSDKEWNMGRSGSSRLRGSLNDVLSFLSGSTG